MDRSKRVVLLSHCILNQNTVVYPLARAKGAYKKIVETIMDAGVGIHQLSCPEYISLGLSRKPMTKGEYDFPDFRMICKDIAIGTIKIVQEYLDNDYEIIGIIGINQSPTCSIHGEQGIFMEELLKSCKIEGINIKTMDVSVDYSDDKDNIFDIEEFIKFIGN